MTAAIPAGKAREFYNQLLQCATSLASKAKQISREYPVAAGAIVGAAAGLILAGSYPFALAGAIAGGTINYIRVSPNASKEVQKTNQAAASARIISTQNSAPTSSLFAQAPVSIDDKHIMEAELLIAQHAPYLADPATPPAQLQDSVSVFRTAAEDPSWGPKANKILGDQIIPFKDRLVVACRAQAEKFVASEKKKAEGESQTPQTIDALIQEARKQEDIFTLPIFEHSAKQAVYAVIKEHIDTLRQQRNQAEISLFRSRHQIT